MGTYDQFIEDIGRDIHQDALPHLPLAESALTAMKQQLHARVNELWLPTLAIDHGVEALQRHGMSKSYDFSADLQRLTVEMNRLRDSHRVWLDGFVRQRLAWEARNSCEAVIRAARHIPKISQLIGYTPSRVVAIRSIGAETHNAGRVALLLEFDGGGRVVYKPVSLTADWAVSSLIRFLMRGVKRRYRLRTPRYLPVGDNYGFIEFLDSKGSLLDPESQVRFFYRAGLLVAFAYGLNITDMHMGNVLAASDCPVLIDLETALYRFPPAMSQSDVRITGLIQGRVEDSHFHSGLQGGGTHRHVRPTAGRTRDGHLVAQYRVPVWQDANRLKDGHELVDPAKYIDVIVDGFEAGYHVIEDGKRDLVHQAGALASRRSWRVRHIIRSTSYYVAHLMWLLQPSLGSREEMETRMSSLLHDHGSPGQEIESNVVVMSELHDLMNGDVPYFWGDVGECTLHHQTGGSVERYFPETALQALASRLHSLGQQDLTVQIDSLREAFG